jgi:hypothetical protein
MELYKPSDRPERLVLSNMQYGLLKWFYNRGQLRTCDENEGLFLDQRSFGSAVARGLLAFDGAVWKLTQAGIEFLKHYEGREPWKETASRQYSHWVKIVKVRKHKEHLARKRRAASA